jgi:hypothetical protein
MTVDGHGAQTQPCGPHRTFPLEQQLGIGVHETEVSSICVPVSAGESAPAGLSISGPPSPPEGAIS